MLDGYDSNSGAELLINRLLPLFPFKCSVSLILLKLHRTSTFTRPPEQNFDARDSWKSCSSLVKEAWEAQTVNSSESESLPVCVCPDSSNEHLEGEGHFRKEEPSQGRHVETDTFPSVANLAQIKIIWFGTGGGRRHRIRRNRGCFGPCWSPPTPVPIALVWVSAGSKCWSGETRT